MAVTKDMLVSELQDLLRLTSFEQTIAQLRRAQAASSSIAEELQANAEKARERQQLLIEAVRQAGGVPDVVGAAVGKAGAFVQTQVNQVQTLQGALLGDLALEHQLRERARYARTMAMTLGYTQVIPVLDRLETAHTATIAWLEERLGEVGRTGTSALRATPLQNVVAVTRRTIGAPYYLTATAVNRVSSLLRRGADKTTEVAQDAADAVVQTTERAVGTAADAAQQATERAAGAAKSATERAAGATQQAVGTATDVAQRATERATDAAAQATARATDTAEQATERAAEATRETADRTAGAAQGAVDSATQAVEQASAEAADQVIDLTDVDEQHEPFAAYGKLTGDSVMRHVADSEDVEHVREVLAYEQAHKNRKGVVQAAQERLSELSVAP